MFTKWLRRHPSAWFSEHLRLQSLWSFVAFATLFSRLVLPFRHVFAFFRLLILHRRATWMVLTTLFLSRLFSPRFLLNFILSWNFLIESSGYILIVAGHTIIWHLFITQLVLNKVLYLIASKHRISDLFILGNLLLCNIPELNGLVVIPMKLMHVLL